jgi:hypothetical protein
MSFTHRACIAAVAIAAVAVPSFAITNDWVVDNSSHG